MKKTSVRSLLPVLFMAGFSSNASAAGFAIAEQSGKGLGSAFSGGAASADDASTVWYNPAGMTKFSGTHISAAMHGIFPKAEYTDKGSILNPALTGGAPVPLTGKNASGDKNALVPNFYMTHSVNDRMSVGFGMNAPFGLVTDYDSDWIGRYHGLRSDVATVNLNPSFAFKVSEQFSIGVGFSAQYIDVKLSSTIDTSAACLAAAGRGEVPLATCAGLGLTTPGNPGTDSQVRFEGDDWSFGYNLGALFEPMEGSRIGLHYRSRIKHDLSGAAEFFYFAPGPAGFGAAAGLSNQTITAGLDLPESVSISGFHQINPQWSVQADITWMNWSRFEQLKINFASGRESITPEDWDDTFRYAIGTTFTMNDKVTLRGGLAFDETPIKNAALRTPRIADEDRIWLAIGGSYALSDSASIDVGYTHIFVDDPEIDYITNFPNTPHFEDSSLLKGTYDASVDIVSVQFNLEF